MTDREWLVRRLNDWGTVEAESLADYLLANGIIIPPEMGIGPVERQIPKKPKNEYTDNLDTTTKIPFCPVSGS